MDRFKLLEDEAHDAQREAMSDVSTKAMRPAAVLLTAPQQYLPTIFVPVPYLAPWHNFWRRWLQVPFQGKLQARLGGLSPCLKELCW